MEAFLLCPYFMLHYIDRTETVSGMTVLRPRVDVMFDYNNMPLNKDNVDNDAFNGNFFFLHIFFFFVPSSVVAFLYVSLV